MTKHPGSYRSGLIKVAIADDHAMFRAGLAALLRENEDIKVVVEAADGKDLLKQLKHSACHIVLLDIEMPGMNGIEAMQHVKEQYPLLKLLFLTTHSENELVYEIMSLGANGLITKDKSITSLVDAIYSVIDKGIYISEEVKDALLKGGRPQGVKQAEPSASLSEREKEVVCYICMQKTSKEIAAILNLSERTIHAHRMAIHHKTKTRNMVGLALYAIKHGIINESDVL